ncbi:DMT family transporter [Coralloluteibacterium stylophorae]|uniref:DMT family transporter n=1 Tax=Coralloluteibacterium stylophorae TaxID=1776034 RepID=A0A8J8AYZ9_9GAMM|nr:DMT family transporter [Coralloluteibacterium stylophorae]MBS7457803.1 DMT family transporter [Coralloluteibacterium stylophorae]
MTIGLGELLSLGSALAWAVGVVMYRQLGAHLPPVTLNVLKNGLVLLAVGLLVLAVHGPAPPAMDAREVVVVLVSGILGIALADTLYFHALNRLGAGRMGIIGNAYSPCVLILGMLVLDERLGALQWLGFLLVSAGVAVIALPARARARATQALVAEDLAGVAAGASVSRPRPQGEPGGGGAGAVFGGIAAMALMAVAIVMVKPVLESQSVLWVTWLRLLGGVGGLALVMTLRGQAARLRPPPGLPWRRLFVAALVGQCLSMLLWLGGFKYAKAAVAAVLNETSSVFILLLAAVWLGERLGRRAFAGIALTLAGVVFMLLG